MFFIKFYVEKTLAYHIFFSRVGFFYLSFLVISSPQIVKLHGNLFDFLNFFWFELLPKLSKKTV